jgi:hypothetical protein
MNQIGQLNGRPVTVIIRAGDIEGAFTGSLNITPHGYMVRGLGGMFVHFLSSAVWEVRGNHVVLKPGKEAMDKNGNQENRQGLADHDCRG